MRTTSITDNPRLADSIDEFGISPFEKGLTTFLRDTNTPITLALQGEWGSGKTSLMNSLKYSLCEEDKLYFDVWLNTWEYSLMQDAQTTLVQIISKLVSVTTAISSPDSAKNAKVLGLLKDLASKTAKIALNSVASGAGDLVDALSQSEQSTIGELRNEPQSIIDEAIKNSDKKGFLFFIDDLDRIDPPVAVELLELLKNIFTLNNCVFILAIDYDVVVKGLKPKFGELTEKNEREFRSFFDKIIQVPFSMPVSNYKIDDFIKQSLTNIGYLNNEESKNTVLINDIAKVTTQTVGNNPRAIKRLLNSLSLIKCINDNKQGDEFKINGEVDLYINFALIAIQVAYPKIYNLLNKSSCFIKWGTIEAIELNLKELDSCTKENLKNSEEFDEEWEQVVYRICEADFFLKHRAKYISNLLNSIKDKILSSIDAQGADTATAIEEHVGRIIKLSAVTNLEANDSSPVEYHASPMLKSIRRSLISSLHKALPEYGEKIRETSRRVQTNAPIAIGDNSINITSFSYKGKIRVKFYTNIWICRDSYESISAYYQTIDGATDAVKDLESDFNLTMKQLNKYECYWGDNFMDGEFVMEKWRYIPLNFYVTLQKPEEFTETEYITQVTNVICKIHNIYLQLKKYREAE